MKLISENREQQLKTTTSELEISLKEEDLLKNQIAELNKCYKHVMESNSILSAEHAHLSYNLMNEAVAPECAN